MPLDVPTVQSALRELGIDAWLLYDFRGLNVLAQRILDLGDALRSRRLYYLIPAEGEPQKLVHRIESAALDHLPGRKHVYLRWQELEQSLAAMVQGRSMVAMEYSPGGANPYISRVDAGTVELVRGFGVDVVSSGNLIQVFEAAWSEAQWQMHLKAAGVTQSAFHRAWAFIAEKARDGGTDEMQVQRVILDHFAEHGLVTDHPPIVAVGPHSGDPHYAPSVDRPTPIRAGDFVLIDLWGKLDRPGAVYSDLTQVGYVGDVVPEQYAQVFEIVACGRDAAIAVVREAMAAGRPLQGWEVDQACRDVIEAAGYGEYFIHRTGHSIGEEDHGNGANIDNLETREDRLVMRRTCFSVEPGIYLPEFGIRSEVNVFIDGDGAVHVTGGEPQTAVLRVLAR